MSILSRPFTYDDLLRERDVRDERLELIEGELLVALSPTPLHALVAHRLTVLLDRSIVERRLGLVLEAPLDVQLAEGTVLQPDLIVLLQDRLEFFGESTIEHAPSLVIEIVSPSTAARDREIKRQIYARYDVPEYWLVDPEARSVTIFSEPRDGRYQHRSVSEDMAVSETIPELAVDLEALFAPVLRSR